ncbi:LEA type 2 family protein [Pseudomonas sp. UBA1879]|uniref:LEA type 2 family protein n=1 Tax=Pseudomonas sp. UBA1879 TaxID=1947305 RepID=UPI0025DFAD2F|nr:LEA type 2 family protein [Pseudomonas sp. UBA1879]
MVFQASVFRILALLIVLLMASGCSTFSSDDTRDPDVKLLKVDVVKARLLKQDLKLRFRIDNPNDSNLWVRGLRYKVVLNDMLIADGEYSDWFIVKANGHKNFSVPIRTNLWEHLKDITRMLGKPNQPIHYRLEGTLKTGFLFGDSVRIGRDGDIIPGDLIPE